MSETPKVLLADAAEASSSTTLSSGDFDAITANLQDVVAAGDRIITESLEEELAPAGADLLTTNDLRTYNPKIIGNLACIVSDGTGWTDDTTPETMERAF